MSAGGQGSRDKPLYTDVAAMLDGTLPEPPRPCVLCRTDGHALFYKGEVNLVFGDPEHGKTWVILAGCAETLIDGGRVIYVDLDHNGAAAIVSRMLLLGVPVEILRDPDRFRHCEPTEVAAVEQVVADCQQWKPDIVVIDSTGELIPLGGGSSRAR
jgi:predicted ATP-dependent serine protease